MKKLFAMMNYNWKKLRQHRANEILSTKRHPDHEK